MNWNSLPYLHKYFHLKNHWKTTEKPQKNHRNSTEIPLKSPLTCPQKYSKSFPFPIRNIEMLFTSDQNAWLLSLRCRRRRPSLPDKIWIASQWRNARAANGRIPMFGNQRRSPLGFRQIRGIARDRVKYGILCRICSSGHQYSTILWTFSQKKTPVSIPSQGRFLGKVDLQGEFSPSKTI